MSTSRTLPSAPRVAATWIEKQGYNDWKSKYLRDAAKNVVFHFSSQAVADLWEHELTGQISDGMWENTPDTGWEFWVSVPIQVGGHTSLSGDVPYNVKTGFAFDKLLPIVGEEMLATMQKSDPSATMGTLLRAIKEIQKALRAARSGKPVQPPGAGAGSQEGPGSALPDAREQLAVHALCWRVVFNVLGLPVKAQDVQAEAFLFASSGSRAGKYHYFAVVRQPRGYAAMSAYGKISGTPKPVVLGQNLDLSTAKDLLSSKARAKMRSGYDPLVLEGTRLNLDAVTGQVRRVASSTAQLTVGRGGLTWDSARKQFSIDASQIRAPFRDVQIFNPVTGNTALFAKSRKWVDREGDVTHWTLEGPRGTTLLIWND